MYIDEKENYGEKKELGRRKRRKVAKNKKCVVIMYENFKILNPNFSHSSVFRAL